MINLIKVGQRVDIHFSNGIYISGTIKYIPGAGEDWVIEDDEGTVYFVRNYDSMRVYPEGAVDPASIPF